MTKRPQDLLRGRQGRMQKMRPGLKAWWSALCLLGSTGALANPPDFMEECASLAAAARIEVLFEDGQITRNNRLGSLELKRMSSFDASPYHSVLGLTHAKPDLAIESSTRILTASDGRACTVPSLTVKLRFSELEVFLARDIPDECQRRFVEAHEMEHVAIWRTHFRAGAKMIQNRMQALFSKPLFAASKTELEHDLKSQVENELRSLLSALHAGARAANLQIDSAAAYQYANNQMMQTCPGR